MLITIVEKDSVRILQNRQFLNHANQDERGRKRKIRDKKNEVKYKSR